MEYDGDRSGAIDERELGALLKGLGMKVSNAKLNKLIKQYDEDESGEIEFSEYVLLLSCDSFVLAHRNQRKNIPSCVDVFWRWEH